MASSSFETESESDDDSDIGGRKGKGKGRVILPLRRSARNRRNASFDDYGKWYDLRQAGGVRFHLVHTQPTSGRRGDDVTVECARACEYLTGGLLAYRLSHVIASEVRYGLVCAS